VDDDDDHGHSIRDRDLCENELGLRGVLVGGDELFLELLVHGVCVVVGQS